MENEEVKNEAVEETTEEATVATEGEVVEECTEACEAEKEESV